MIQEKELNKEQIEAVNFVNGNLLIIASAGTGKTTTIVERYSNLIKNHNYKPNEILMTTFTNKAAKDMIRKIFEKTNTKPYYVGTMHSIFLKFLRENASIILPSQDFTIIDDPDKKMITKEIITENKIENQPDTVKYFLMWISKFKNRGIYAETLSSEINLDVNEELIEDILDDEIIKINPKLRKYVNLIYKKYEGELRKNKIPCHLSKSKDFFEREEIKDIFSFLKLKVNPHSKIDFERLLVLINGIGKAKVEKFEEIAVKNKFSYIDSLELYKELKLNQDIAKELRNFKLAVNNFKDPLNSFLKDFGYVNYIKNKYSYDSEKLKDKLENIKVLEDLFYLEENTKEEVKNFLDSLIELEKREKTRDKITLSTIHSAKGLEWSHVFLASCNEKTFPFYFKEDLSKAKRDSELRLFYVALSRAKKTLFITHYEESDWGAETQKSQFLDILD